MQVQLRFFASLREALGTSQQAVDTAAATVGQLRDELMARGEPWASALARGQSLRMSVDQVMVNEDAPLAEGAEVAFFPPVTGG